LLTPNVAFRLRVRQLVPRRLVDHGVSSRLADGVAALKNRAGVAVDARTAGATNIAGAESWRGTRPWSSGRRATFNFQRAIMLVAVLSALSGLATVFVTETRIEPGAPVALGAGCALIVVAAALRLIARATTPLKPGLPQSQTELFAVVPTAGDALRRATGTAVRGSPEWIAGQFLMRPDVRYLR
jgi:hypothetical protein